jgi:hypothetical protein
MVFHLPSMGRTIFDRAHLNLDPFEKTRFLVSFPSIADKYVTSDQRLRILVESLKQQIENLRQILNY